MDSLPATIADLTPSAATLSPDEVLALSPVPDYVLYE